MPQLVLEYSSNIKKPVDFKDLFLQCHRILETVGVIRIGNCKSRAVKREVYLIGDGSDPHEAFVHVDLSFVAERSLEIKQQIGGEIMKVLEKHFSHPKLQITLKISSIERATYFKFPEGSFSPPI